MAKMKSHDLKGIQFHNQRERESRTNPDINKEKSEQNYDLVHAQNIDYNKHVKKIIDSQKVSTRKTRKDAVLVNELLVTSDRDFFDKLLPEDEKRFFEKSKDFFATRYGDQNLAYATVHVDERTPHMHLGVVPMREGRLQGKNVFNRAELLAIQEEYPKHMQEHGFSLNRGEQGSDREHVDTLTLKKETLSSEVKILEEKMTVQSHIFDSVRPNLVFENEMETEVVKKNFLQKEKIQKATGNYVVSPQQLDDINKKIHAAMLIKKDYDYLRNTDLVVKNKKLNARVEELFKAGKTFQNGFEKQKSLIHELERENDDLRGQIKMLYKTTRDFIKDHTPDLKSFRGLFKTFLDRLKGNINEEHENSLNEPETSEFEQIYNREEKIDRGRGLGL